MTITTRLLDEKKKDGAEGVRQPVEGHLRLVSNVPLRRHRLDGRVVHGRFLPLPYSDEQIHIAKGCGT